MTTYRRSILCLLLVIGGVGCGWNRSVAGRPGTLDQQRFAASMHDPYADNDAGPEIVGSRPREFAKPRPEPTRNRSWWEWMTGQGQR
jgi:hypothetical protein